MARPRHLPEFNPWVPNVIVEKYKVLEPVALECVRRTVANEKFASLYWLKLYNRLLKLITKHKLIESPNKKSVALTDEESAALRWAHHKGKWDWEGNAKTNERKPVSKKSRRVECEKEKSQKQETKRKAPAKRRLDQQPV